MATERLPHQGIILPPGASPERIVTPLNPAERLAKEKEVLSKTIIYLVALPGAGKSTFGEYFADQYGLTFKDSDVLFHDWTGFTPTEYIDTYGRPAFQQKEHSVLELASTRPGIVIATGGGMVEYRDNLGILLGGDMVYLDVPPEVAARRVFEDPNNDRTGLKGTYEAILAEETARWERRHEKYEHAQHRVKADKLKPAQLALIVKQMVVRRHAPQLYAA